MTVRYDGLRFDWFGYATARIEAPDGTVVYTDPGRYGTLDGTWESEYGGAPENLDDAHPHGPAYDAQDADVVVVTHDHHYSDDGVERVASDDATVVVYEGVSADGVAANSGRDVVEPEELPYDVVRVGYGDDLTIAGVEVDVIPAYNEPGGPDAAPDIDVTHPYELGCGYVVSVDGTRCFWTGDSDAIPEHEGLDVDVFLPTIARSFTMDRHEAADLAAQLDPGLVLPIHYNTFDALGSDSAAFAADVAKRSVPVALDEGWPADL
ncbi:Zn-dependent hydrolase-like protein [Salinarchaeum sp. Harcht-Bsk1]|uniref:MBL fold metallo-hydrolase n=1 Tax=Salinarchaeum sp. Harcht-Bsk1 TaxID=1333523 RepID=UPI0003423246|nr:MBL fold metallo-hydrolase [Salinarchaeum sp. Harcht-Bsk1]AGN00818.1 Zn-dependent hydrolase-like protein [Salinarchaeum sp. Harcht-Bsk1]